MRRRAFFAVLGGAAVAPLAVAAQQPILMRRVGVLTPFPEHDPLFRQFVTAFVQALSQFGWVDGQNIRIDRRFATGDPELFKTYAAELVALAPDAILASTLPAVAAVRQQTSTIPIDFVLLPDPVGLGFVQSLTRPGGNITGFSAYDTPIFEKWLQLLKEVAPSVARVAVIYNPEVTAGAYIPLFNRAIEVAAPPLGVTVTFAPVQNDVAIEEAIAAQAHEPGGGLITLPDPFIAAQRDAVIAAAARHGLPLMGLGAIFPRAGGLMSYGFDPVDMYAQAASYIDRILQGESPANLPVQRPTKFSLVINLKTARALGLTIPPAILARADEVIE